jgi:hypothetical protein
MVDYLWFWGKGNKKTAFCRLTGKPCDIITTPKQVQAMKNGNFEGCSAMCDRPQLKILEDKYDAQASRGDYPDE